MFDYVIMFDGVIMMKNVFFISLGCDKNLVDSEVLLGLIERGGFGVVGDVARADVAVVNTCGFIKAAVTESVEQILRISGLKSEGRLRAVVVVGCLVGRYEDEILSEMPEVDAVVGKGDYGRIADIINEVLGGRRTLALSDKNVCCAESAAEDRLLTGLKHFAYLKIAEGCNNCCSYCTIWQIKGAYVSRSIESLVRETEKLAARGVRELILVAQDTAQYGIDLYGESRLHELVRRLSDVNGIEWLRILYAYPEHITDVLIDEMAGNAKCCHYIDIPIQHGCDRILKLMGRQSTRSGIERLIAKLRCAMPDIVIRTTLIVGFPGESDEEFGEVVDFISKMRFDRLGVFEYSREDGTKAAEMPGQIKGKVKRARRDELMKAQMGISKDKLRMFVGRTLRVLIDGRGDGGYCGRSYMDCYGIDGAVLFNSEREINAGEFTEVLVTGSSEYDLYGEALRD